MSAKKRKLCWNCEGNVHIHSTKCPYCGIDLQSAENQASHRDPQPPYAQERHSSYQESAPPPYYHSVNHEERDQETPFGHTPYVEPKDEERGALLEPEVRSALLPMFLLIPGAFFLLFGMILLLFSDNGILTLRWNAHFWFVYLLLAAPLLWYGWRTLNRTEEESPVPRRQPVEQEEERRFGPSEDPYDRY